MDSSRVSTFLISILLIVYGSFRSLNMEEEERLKKKECSDKSCEKSKLNFCKILFKIIKIIKSCLLSDVQTLDTMQALFLPLGASVSLLIMFFFFDSLSILFAFCTASKFIDFELLLPFLSNIFFFAVIASIALAFLLLPPCQYILRLCVKNRK